MALSLYLHFRCSLLFFWGVIKMAAILVYDSREDGSYFRAFFLDRNLILVKNKVHRFKSSHLDQKITLAHASNKNY